MSAIVLVEDPAFRFRPSVEPCRPDLRGAPPTSWPGCWARAAGLNAAGELIRGATRRRAARVRPQDLHVRPVGVVAMAVRRAVGVVLLHDDAAADGVVAGVQQVAVVERPRSGRDAAANERAIREARFEMCRTL